MSNSGSKTLNQSMGDVMVFMKNYTDPLEPTRAEYAKAQDDINDSVIDDLFEEIENNNLVTWEHDSDGDRPNYDNLVEWLQMYYELRHK